MTIENCSLTDNLANDAKRKQERSWYYEAQTAWAQAHRLAMELEAVLLSCKDTAATAKWWDSAHEALEEHRQLSKVEPPETPVYPMSLDADRWFYLAEKYKADLSMCDGRLNGTVWFNEIHFLRFCEALEGMKCDTLEVK